MCKKEKGKYLFAFVSFSGNVSILVYEALLSGNENIYNITLRRGHCWPTFLFNNQFRGLSSWFCWQFIIGTQPIQTIQRSVALAHLFFLHLVKSTFTFRTKINRPRLLATAMTRVLVRKRGRANTVQPQPYCKWSILWRRSQY